jgi:hypothetical protein
MKLLKGNDAKRFYASRPEDRKVMVEIAQAFFSGRPPYSKKRKPHIPPDAIEVEVYGDEPDSTDAQ